MNKKFKGQGSSLFVKQDKIILSHGKNKQLTSKSKPEIEIFYSDLDCLVLDKPGLFSGYCYFLRKGYEIDSMKKMDIMVDEYAITLAFFPQYKQFLKAQELINQQIIRAGQENPDKNVKKDNKSKLVSQLFDNYDNIIEFKGYSGSICVSARSVVFKYKPILHRGGKGSKSIDINRISSISISKPSITSGKIQIFYEGFSSRGYRSLNEEPNEIAITNINQYNQMVEAKELIETLQAYYTREGLSVQQVVDSSPADDIRKYKTLLDDGIISEEEFEKKKQELLR